MKKRGKAKSNRDDDSESEEDVAARATDECIFLNLDEDFVFVATERDMYEQEQEENKEQHLDKTYLREELLVPRFQRTDLPMEPHHWEASGRVQQTVTANASQIIFLC